MNRYDLFPTTFKTWNYLYTPFRTPAFLICPEAGNGKKWLFKKINGAKKGVMGLAFGVATLATGIFDLLAIIYRYYLYISNKKNLYQKETSFLSSEEKILLKTEIKSYCEKKKIAIPQNKREEWIEQAIACFARSKKYYAPMALKWVDYLLNRANRENKKLVFMARDGIAPYKLALQILKKRGEKYPNVEPSKIILGYFSRKLIRYHIDEYPDDLIKDYMRQIGIRSGDKCIFIDIGFFGTTIGPMQKVLKGMGVDSEFEFLISKTDKAQGFMIWETRSGSKEIFEPLANQATHWLESTHQGTFKSPQCLVKEADTGIIYPDTLLPGKEQTFFDQPLNYLLRKWGQKAIKRAGDENPEKINFDAAKKNLNQLFFEINSSKRPLFVID